MIAAMKCCKCDEFASTIIATMRAYHEAERELAAATFANKDSSVLNEINERVASLIADRSALLNAFTTHIEQAHETPRLLDGLGWSTYGRT